MIYLKEIKCLNCNGNHEFSFPSMTGKEKCKQCGNNLKIPGRKRILVVDDEEHIRYLYGEELYEEGFIVFTKDNGDKLLEDIALCKPDVVVLDIKMVDYNGLDLLQDIRDVYYDLPVILCTAYDTFKEDVKSIAADYYVIKSYDLSELKSRIKMCLDDYCKDEIVCFDGQSLQVRWNLLHSLFVQMLNKQQYKCPHPDKVAEFISFRKYVKSKYIDLDFSQIELYFKSLCLDFYYEIETIEMKGREWLLKNNNSLPNDQESIHLYKSILDLRIVSVAKFNFRLNILQKRLEDILSKTYTNLVTAHKKLNEDLSSQDFRQSLCKIFEMQFKKTTPDNLCKNFQTVLSYFETKDIRNMSLKFLSAIHAFYESSSDDQIKLGNVFLSDIRHDFKRTTNQLFFLVQELKTSRNEKERRLISELDIIHGDFKLLWERLKDITFLSSFVKYKSFFIKDLFSMVLKQVKICKPDNLSSKISPADLRIYSDERILEIVLRNVLKNAIEACSNGFMIKMSARKHYKRANYITVIIQDDGIGIPKSLRRRIFQPHVSSKKGHMGMGLAISKYALSQLDGEIQIRSGAKGGTRVSINIKSE